MLQGVEVSGGMGSAAGFESRTTPHSGAKTLGTSARPERKRSQTRPPPPAVHAVGAHRWSSSSVHSNSIHDLVIVGWCIACLADGLGTGPWRASRRVRRRGYGRTSFFARGSGAVSNVFAPECGAISRLESGCRTHTADHTHALKQGQGPDEKKVLPAPSSSPPSKQWQNQIKQRGVTR